MSPRSAVVGEAGSLLDWARFSRDGFRAPVSGTMAVDIFPAAPFFVNGPHHESHQYGGFRGMASSGSFSVHVS